MNMTARAIEYPFRERHLLAMSTPAACLTRIGRIDFDSCSSSFFRFGEQFVKKSRPRGICNAFGKTMVMGHAVHMQVFYHDDPKSLNDGTRMLMGEVIAPELDPFVDSCHNVTMLASLRRAFRKLSVLALYLYQGLFFLAEKAGVLNLFSSGERRKGLQTDVYPHLFLLLRQAFRFTLTREGDVPFASRRAAYRAGFHFSPDRAMIDHLEGANFREAHTVIMGGRPGDGDNAEARLREGEGVIPAFALETWKARFLGVFSETSKECLESQINPHGDILQDLRMNPIEERPFLFQDREGILLLKTGERDTVAFIRRLAHFQQVIIQPPTLFKGLAQLLFLLLSWKQTVRKLDFVHFWG